MADTLGWINLALIIFMSSVYPIKRIYQKHKNIQVLTLYKKTRLAHPIIGIIVILIGVIHGYMQLRGFQLHTGTLVLLASFLMAFIAIIGPKIKVFRKKWHLAHKRMAILLWVFILIHLFL